MNKDEISEEIGDLLFVIVNLARRLDVEPETALKKTNRKFRQRFSFIESELKTQDKSFDESDLEEMDALWNKAKYFVNFCKLLKITLTLDLINIKFASKPNFTAED